MLTKLLLQKLQAAEGKVNQLENEMNNDSKVSSQKTTSPITSPQKSFEDISASINSKLEILDRMSQNDSISEDTPKESTKLSDQFSHDKSDTITNLSAISNSTLTEDKPEVQVVNLPQEEQPPVNPLPIPGIEFGVPQSPVRLDANDIEQLTGVGSTFSSSVNTSTSLEMTNQLVDWAIQHGIAQVRQALADEENNTLDRLNDSSSEEDEFRPIEQSHNSLSTSLSSFLRNEAELEAENEPEVASPTKTVSESETEPLTQIDATPKRSATELLAEVVELHKTTVGGENTLERVEGESDEFKQIETENLTEESAAFEALEHEVSGIENEIQPSNLSNIEEVTEESSKDVTPSVPQPRTGPKEPMSIQEAFMMRKQKFIENSKKRQEKVKGKSNTPLNY